MTDGEKPLLPLMKLNVFCVLRIFSFAQPCVLLILRLQVTYHFCILQLLQIPWGACLCAPYSTGKSPQPTSPPALSPHLGHTSAISFPFHFPFAHCVTWTFNREPLLPSPSWKHNPNSYNVTNTLSMNHKLYGDFQGTATRKSW